MNKYYNAAGEVLGRAWGFSRCWGGADKPHPTEHHNPHSHDPMYAMYGPYFCPGWPEVEIYDNPPPKPLNPQSPLDKVVAKLAQSEVLSANEIKDKM